VDGVLHAVAAAGEVGVDVWREAFAVRRGTGRRLHGSIVFQGVVSRLVAGALLVPQPRKLGGRGAKAVKA
jgi:hypothetical protein